MAGPSTRGAGIPLNLISSGLPMSVAPCLRGRHFARSGSAEALGLRDCSPMDSLTYAFPLYGWGYTACSKLPY